MKPEEFSIVVCVSVFVAYAVIDALYAWYVYAVAKHRAFMSANIGAGMHFLMAYGVISYTNNWWYILPLAAGSWLGTFCVVKWEGSKKDAAQLMEE